MNILHTLLTPLHKHQARKRLQRERSVEIPTDPTPRRVSTKLSPAYTKRDTAWLKHCRAVIEGRA